MPHSESRRGGTRRADGPAPEGRNTRISTPFLRRRKHHPLQLLVLGVLVGPAIFMQGAESVEELLLGIVLTIIAFNPLVKWSIGPKDTIPVFEIYCFSVGVYFGLPMIFGDNLSFKEWHYDFDVRIKTGIIILLGLLSAMVAYTLSKRRRSIVKNRSFLVLPDRISGPLFIGFLVLAVALLVIRTFGGFPELGAGQHVIYALLSGLGIVSSFMLCRIAGEGKLDMRLRWLVFGLIGIASVLNVTDLLLAPAIRWLFPALFGYAIGRGRLPWRTSVLIFVVLAFFSLGKSDMRDVYWGGSQRSVVSISGVVERIVRWGKMSWQQLQSGQRQSNQSLLNRLNLINVTGVIIQETPETKPYLYGKTYGMVLPLLVPRFLWPTKPIGHAATITLTLYYGIQSERVPIRTSIGVGLFAEAYANFGLVGIVALNALIGWGLGWVYKFGYHVPPLSFRGLMTVSFLAFSVYLESTLAEIVVPFLHMTVVISSAFWFFMIKRRFSVRGKRFGGTERRDRIDVGSQVNARGRG